MQKIKSFAIRNKIPVILIGGFVSFIAFYLWIWMPYPYPPQYWIKRAFVTPKYICQDGTVTWAKSPAGFCRKHGGVKGRY